MKYITSENEEFRFTASRYRLCDEECCWYKIKYNSTL